MGDEASDDTPSLRTVIGSSILGFLGGYLVRRVTRFIGTVFGLSLVGYELTVALGYKTEITKTLISPVNAVITGIMNAFNTLIDKLLNIHQDHKPFVISFTGGFLIGFLQLDLDFLERRQQDASAAKSTTDSQENTQSQIEISPESVDRVKVILLGAPAVGKSSIIQQFVWNDFTEDYIPTDRKYTYYPSVITNNRLYEIKITDLPVIPYFPVNSFYEWTDYRFYGLRNASAYVLVFDLSNPETFQYVKTIREQICESRNVSNVPILIVGNKEDLIVRMEGAGSGKPAISSGADDRRREIVNIVKKQWKYNYVECSAKYNWRVVAVFKELITMVDNVESRDQSPMLDNIQEALDRNKCVII